MALFKQPQQNPDVINGRQLVSRPMTDEEMEALIASTEDPDMRAEYASMLEDCRLDPDNRNWYVMWTNRTKDTDEEVAHGWFDGLPMNYSVEISYGVFEGFEGKNYDLETLVNLGNWALRKNNTLNFIEVEAGTNEVAQKLMRMGFKVDDARNAVDAGEDGEDGEDAAPVQEPVPAVVAKLAAVAEAAIPEDAEPVAAAEGADAAADAEAEGEAAEPEADLTGHYVVERPVNNSMFMFMLLGMLLGMLVGSSAGMIVGALIGAGLGWFMNSTAKKRMADIRAARDEAILNGTEEDADEDLEEGAPAAASETDADPAPVTEEN